MSLTMTDSEVILRDNNNKRKYDDAIELPTSKCEIESSNFVEDDPNSEHLSDVTDSETSDTSVQNNIKLSTSNPTSQSYESSSNNNNNREKSAQTIHNPQYGQVVNRREFRRAGPYIIGQRLGHSPVDSIVQYLAKKENTSEFVQLKILLLNNDSAATEKQLQDERQGKMLLHNEFSLLSLLKNEPGVVQHHGMFSDTALEEATDTVNGNNFYTGNTRKRLVLVLDCLTPHDFDPTSLAYMNLQQYLINRKKLSEIEALKIFYEVITVVERLHDRNIIHRDLKLGNIVLNKYSSKIKIINFCLGKYLLNENDLLFDQRGSPAYISPDVLCGKSYKGKPSDMWALGVVLFMMLYRQFPFFESTPAALFKKIISAEYTIPLNNEVSKDAEHIICGLLQLNPEKRLTAKQVRNNVKAIIDSHAGVRNIDRLVPLDHGVIKTSSVDSNDQVVPTMTTSNTSGQPSRKRRRSTDKIIDGIIQRGISIQQIDTNIVDRQNSNIYKFQKFLGENRRSYKMPTPCQISTALPMPNPSSAVSSQPFQIPCQRIVSLADSRSRCDRMGPPISTLIRYPNSIRIIPRGAVRNNSNPNQAGNQSNGTSIRTVPLPSSLINAFMTRDQNRSNIQSNMASILRSPPNNNFQFIRPMNRPANNNDNHNININIPNSNNNIRNNVVRNMRQIVELSNNFNNQSPSERFRQAMVRLQLPNSSRQESRRLRRGRSSMININHIERNPSNNN